MPGFVNSQGPMPVQDMAPADPCKTVVGPAVVVIPYPNMGMRSMAVPSQTKLLPSAMPAHNLSTSIPLTNGDNAGALGGVASGIMMGPARNTMGSTNFFVGGSPATTMGAPTLQNNQAPGMTAGACQIKLMSMR
ncbi:DUF4150 domain-containing protein [Xanthobacteraceae bacterium A53D]